MLVDWWFGLIYCCLVWFYFGLGGFGEGLVVMLVLDYLLWCGFGCDLLSRFVALFAWCLLVWCC